MLKNLIFDFDGTLADTLDLVMTLFTELSDKHKFSKVEIPNIKILKDRGAKEFIGSLNINPMQIKEIMETIKQKEALHIANVKIFPELQNILVELKNKNIGLGILTSNSVENVHLFLKENNIDFFDFVISENNLFGKDVALKQIISEKGLAPQKTAYVGDEDRDIEAAKKAGLKTIAVTWGYNSKSLLQSKDPDYLIDSATELLNI